MSLLTLGPEVASRVEALVGAIIRPLSGQTGVAGASVQTQPEPFSLAFRFAVASAIILFNGMVLLGSWVGNSIEDGVVQNAATQLTIPIEPHLASIARSLQGGSIATANDHQSVDSILKNAIDSEAFVAVIILRPDGTVSHATEKSLVGQTLPRSSELTLALTGKATAKLGTTQGSHLFEKLGKAPLLKIYMPIRSSSAEAAVVGAAAFIQDATLLSAGISEARRNTWLIVGLSGVAMLGLLYAIVSGGSRLIGRQRQALENRISDQEVLIRQNSALRSQVQAANRRGTELNERFLRRVSSDLHDGPAQNLALALLRLDELAPVINVAGLELAVKGTSALSTIKRATSEALREIRNISSGLALPELQKISPSDALNIAARAHERATGTPVLLSLNNLPPRLPLPLTICLFRFAQEGLNNAFRHANGEGQRVKAEFDGNSIAVEVIDSGPGFSVEERLGQSERIGLAGLRHRIESLGGTLGVQSTPGAGTRLCLCFENAVTGDQNA